MTLSWLNDLKQNVSGINIQEDKNRRVYGEKPGNEPKQLRKSYFMRPKILTDWEYDKKKKNQGKPTREIRVKQFSSQNDYDKPWNKLKYEYKINRIIHFVKMNQMDNETKKLLIRMTKTRKIKLNYEDGEIKEIINLEELQNN